MRIAETLARMTTRLHGDRNVQTLELRLFNITCLYGGLTCLVYSLVNYALGLGLSGYAVIFPAGLLLVITYAFARYHSLAHRWFRLLVFPVLLLFWIALIQLWFVNAGTQGGTQYFFFALAGIQMVLIRGWLKIGVLFLFIATSMGLIAVEYQYPHLVRGFDGNEEQRYMDILISFPGAMLVLALVVGSVKRNFDRVYKKIEAYQLEFHEDLTLASNLQKSVYEFDPTLASGYDIAVKVQPSGELSGDVFDVSRPAPERLRIFLADARGHGINASLSAMLIKSEWANLNQSSLSPGRSLWLLNRRIVNRYKDNVTFSAVLLDLSERDLIFCSAGHLVQYLVTPDAIKELSSTGPPIGMLDDSNYYEETLELTPESRLVLFTDALTEQRDPTGQEIGVQWLKELLHKSDLSAQKMLDTILKQYASRLGQSHNKLILADDLTLLIVGPQ
ncbi:MAG: serine/threonine-protein phosphatase [Leptospiraceae bacterium]|nr:serine/threonine-protein phosphatase [Leptospiraceae bacterium]